MKRSGMMMVILLAQVPKIETRKPYILRGRGRPRDSRPGGRRYKSVAGDEVGFFLAMPVDW